MKKIGQASILLSSLLIAISFGSMAVGPTKSKTIAGTGPLTRHLNKKLSNKGGIRLGKKFFAKRKEAAWRTKVIPDITDERLCQMMAELWPNNDQIDDRGRKSRDFVSYYRFLRDAITGELRDFTIRIIYTLYSMKDNEKYLEPLKLIEILANSHENHCVARFSNIMRSISNILDDTLEGRGSVIDDGDAIQSVALSKYRNSLMNDSMGELIEGMEESESVMAANNIYYAYSDDFAVDNGAVSSLDSGTIPGETTKSDKVAKILMSKFDVFDIGKFAYDKDTGEGFLNKLDRSILDRYLSDCEKIKLTFRDYCYITRKDIDDTRMKILELVDQYEKESDPEDDGTYKAALLLWVNDPEKVMSFDELKECLVALDTYLTLSQGIAPELVCSDKEKIYYIANVFMIARMFKDGTFVVTE